VASGGERKTRHRPLSVLESHAARGAELDPLRKDGRKLG